MSYLDHTCYPCLLEPTCTRHLQFTLSHLQYSAQSFLLNSVIFKDIVVCYIWVSLLRLLKETCCPFPLEHNTHWHRMTCFASRQSGVERKKSLPYLPVFICASSMASSDRERVFAHTFQLQRESLQRFISYHRKRLILIPAHTFLCFKEQFIINGHYCLVLITLITFLLFC